MSNQSEDVNMTENARSELSGYSIDQIEPGMTAIYARTVTESDIVAFAGVSGDG